MADSPPFPETLEGARIQRVDSPSAGVLALTLRIEGETVALVFFGTITGPDVCLLPERPRGAPAGAFAQKLRRTLQNGRVVDLLLESTGLVRLRVARGAHRAALVSIAEGAPTGFLLLDADDRIMASSGLNPSPHTGDKWTAPADEACPLKPRDLLSTHARRFHAASEQFTQQKRHRLLKRIRSGRKRAARKAEAIRSDIARVDSVQDLRLEGQLILSSLHQIERGQTALEAMNWSASPPAPRRIKLRADTPPKDQAEERFHRARRLERGATKAEERLRLAEDELARLVSLEDRCRAAETDDALGELAQAADAAGVRGAMQSLVGASSPQSRRRPANPTRVSFRRYLSADQLQIWVGKGGADNDRLTLDHARPHDRWFHARGCPGAHVIVKLKRNGVCPPETLLDAATLAAHYSKLRADSVVDVQHTDRRYVRKPRGAAPGQVLIEREKVIALRLEPSRLERLLKSELRGNLMPAKQNTPPR